MPANIGFTNYSFIEALANLHTVLIAGAIYPDNVFFAFSFVALTFIYILSKRVFTRKEHKMQVTVKKPGVPVGSYLAIFLSIDPIDNQYGPALRWVFEITSGPYISKTISRFTRPEFTTNNAAGKMLNGIVGRQVEADEEIDLSDYFGKLYQIEVKESPKGESVRVERCYPSNPKLNTIIRDRIGFPHPPKLPTMEELMLAGEGHQPEPE